MTIAELHERLEELIEQGHGEAIVFLAHQPNYPLEVKASDQTARVRINGENRFYIAEGYGSGGYLAGIASRKLGWADNQPDDDEEDEDEDES